MRFSQTSAEFPLEDSSVSHVVEISIFMRFPTLVASKGSLATSTSLKVLAYSSSVAGYFLPRILKTLNFG